MTRCIAVLACNVHSHLEMEGLEATTHPRCSADTDLLARAADVGMLRALRATPPVLHEQRKSNNVLRFMIGRMAVAVLMTPTDLPFTSAAVRFRLLLK